jgi:ActR/RegA family two-component response regulator
VPPLCGAKWRLFIWQRKYLIVEDDENIVEVLSFNLEKEGYRGYQSL